MSNLNNLTAKILADSERKSRQIIQETEAEAARMVKEQEAEASRERERILAEAETEAVHRREQAILSKTLAIRDENLAAKQQVLDRVFAAALERLNGLSKEECWNFITRCLSGLELDGEEIFFPAGYGVTSIDELNAHLKSLGKKGNLKLGNGARREPDGGFLLSKDGIEQNFTFAALVDYHRYELESEVLDALYG